MKLFLLFFLIVFSLIGFTESFGQDEILEHVESFPIIDSKGVPHNTYFVHVDAENNIYLLHADVDKIVKLDSNGKFLLEFGGRGSDPGEFGKIGSMASDSDGNLYVTDSNPNYRIQKFNSEGKFVSFFANNYSNFYESKSIGGIEIDKDDNVYVSSKGQIIKFDSSGNELRVFGKYGSYVGESRPISDIAIDSQGNVYGVDSNLRKIIKFSPDGEFLFEFGVSINLGHTIDPDETVHPGEFMSPTGIAIDSKDNLYVVDSFGDSLQVFNSDGDFAYLLGGTSESIFHAPSGITITEDDFVIVADTNNLVIRKFNPDTNNFQYTKLDEKKFRTLDDVIEISINETFFHYGDTILISAQSGDEIVVFDPNNEEILHLYGNPPYEIPLTGDLWDTRGTYKVEVSNSVSLDRVSFFVDDTKNPNVFEPRVVSEPPISQKSPDQNSNKILENPTEPPISDEDLSLDLFSYSSRTLFPLLVYVELLLSIAVYYFATIINSKINVRPISVRFTTILSILPFTSFYAFDRVGRFKDALLLLIPTKAVFALFVIVSWDFTIPYIVCFMVLLTIVSRFIEKFTKEWNEKLVDD